VPLLLFPWCSRMTVVCVVFRFSSSKNNLTDGCDNASATAPTTSLPPSEQRGYWQLKQLWVGCCVLCRANKWPYVWTKICPHSKLVSFGDHTTVIFLMNFILWTIRSCAM
jgi:hypothetical protein